MKFYFSDSTLTIVFCYTHTHTHQGLCTFVAALIQYFFLCVFCWMLAEGIMLYLLVVRVFGTAAQKWYWLLILGWGEWKLNVSYRPNSLKECPPRMSPHPLFLLWVIRSIGAPWDFAIQKSLASVKLLGGMPLTTLPIPCHLTNDQYSTPPPPPTHTHTSLQMCNWSTCHW